MLQVQSKSKTLSAVSYLSAAYICMIYEIQVRDLGLVWSMYWIWPGWHVFNDVDADDDGVDEVHCLGFNLLTSQLYQLYVCIHGFGYGYIHFTGKSEGVYLTKYECMNNA